MKKAFVVLAATLSISSAFAQTAAPAAAASPAAAATHREQHVDQRITYLHSALKITPAQETQWNAFADVMRSNNQTMTQLFEQRKENAQRNALDDMKQYAQISQAHADGMQKLVAAFEPLYNSLSPEQKTLADNAFRGHNTHHPVRGHLRHHGSKPASPAPASESGGN